MIKKYFSWKLIVCCVSALLLFNCKRPYDPKLKPTQSNFLVVEGFIDGAALTKIKLSRTRVLSAGDTAAVRNELNANVSIEDDHQNIYLLKDAGNGIYANTNIFNLNPSYQYRLHILTSNGKEYFSDFVPFKQSPPIDTIGWKTKNEGVQVFVNTHDESNTTKYYRWEYDETWEIHSAYNTYLKYDTLHNAVVFRNDQVHVCWRSDSFNKILLGSSAKLTSDVIDQMPLVFIEPHDRKLSVLYSIRVKQFALDLKGYNYWEAMKNNSENVGSIFDPQPNQTVGNIHCVSDPSETVVGYIGAGNSFNKRVFISNDLMPLSWNGFPDCPVIAVPNIKDSLLFYFNEGGMDPISETTLASGALVYSASFADCVDCTTSGTNIKPVFWP